MSTEKEEMKRALNAIVIPELRKLNFKGTLPHFRRLADDRLNLLTFQFDKNGGGFIIEIANCNKDGYTTSWGEKLEPNKITSYDLFKRRRIYSDLTSKDTSTDNWYRYDRTSLKEIINIYESISDDVLSNLEFVKDYWLNGEMN